MSRNRGASLRIDVRAPHSPRAPEKSGCVLCETAQVKYALMAANKNHFDVVLMCRVLAVSRSGYYSWARRPPSALAQDNAELDASITAVFTSQKGRAGSSRWAYRRKGLPLAAIVWPAA